MDIQPLHTHASNHPRGQALVKYAALLHIVLILVFAIIEIGREPTSTVAAAAPFDCNQIVVSNVTFLHNYTLMEMWNDNRTVAYLTRVVLHWETRSDYPDMYVREMRFGAWAFWLGQDGQPDTDTSLAADNQAPNLPGKITDLTYGLSASGDTVSWIVVFDKGPHELADKFTPETFRGSTFFFATLAGVSCARSLNLDHPIRPTPIGMVTRTPMPTDIPLPTLPSDCSGGCACAFTPPTSPQRGATVFASYVVRPPTC